MPSGRLVGCAGAIAIAAALTACDMGRLTVNTTAKVLKRAQPSLKMESDYELAARAVPATLKTVEGFWNVSPDNEILTGLLTEGYCQYGTAFVEDEWEIAVFAKDLERTAELNARSTKIFVRCLNYALRTLGKEWQEKLFKDTDTVNALIAKADAGKRDALMWAAYALGSIINHNLNDVEIIAFLPTVKAMFQRIIELDAKTKWPVTKDGKPDCAGTNADKCVYHALPHVALGMLMSAAGKDLGGNVEGATKHFQDAIAATGGRMLLPKTLYGYRVGKMTQDKKLFRDTLLEVLATPPSIWPEQRLATELAQRRARRYLKLEKEIFQ
jgi:hypothetical protein